MENNICFFNTFFYYHIWHLIITYNKASFTQNDSIIKKTLNYSTFDISHFLFLDKEFLGGDGILSCGKSEIKCTRRRTRVNESGTKAWNTRRLVNLYHFTLSEADKEMRYRLQSRQKGNWLTHEQTPVVLDISHTCLGIFGIKLHFISWVSYNLSVAMN